MSWNIQGKIEKKLPISPIIAPDEAELETCPKVPPIPSMPAVLTITPRQPRSFGSLQAINFADSRAKFNVPSTLF